MHPASAGLLFFGVFGAIHAVFFIVGIFSGYICSFNSRRGFFAGDGFWSVASRWENPQSFFLRMTITLVVAVVFGLLAVDDLGVLPTREQFWGVPNNKPLPMWKLAAIIAAFPLFTLSIMWLRDLVAHLLGRIFLRY